MKILRNTALGLILMLSAFAVGCTNQPGVITNSNNPASASPAVAASPNVSSTAAVTLPVLDALFSDQGFKTTLQTKLQLTDEQLAQIQKIATDEVVRLRDENAEDQTNGTDRAEQSRQRATEAIGVVLGAKTDEFFGLARDYWIAGGLDKGATTEPTATLPTVPNSVPKDTRVVVNIPAFRMDVFKNGELVKSYKIGIGYPEFPLPTGLRKAETIIFNPTWTPPDEPWVKNAMKGQKVAAGSKLNPLGPIKIPIGSPSLIHGGKSPAKIGTFASHGCVGLTTAQVKDFARVLAETAGAELSDAQIQKFLRNPTRTQAVKLAQTVPVELRYETIVMEDGTLHIYRDVYNQDSNTLANLRAVLEANKTSLEDLSDDDRAEVLEAVNAMSLHPSKQNANSKSVKSVNSAVPSPSPAMTDANDATAKRADQKPRAKKPIAKSQKEVVIELAGLKGKGYPAAVKLDTGSGKPAPQPEVAKSTQ
ncbi:MAG TPA: L,D-transpeptidase family protein [Pyrinomonadaceae bacterium]|jgi:lipoprotein-anchoring transpeptidase ErfK/SrfK|nr:L,D-transpeptidase family protein [Pyrinomonadaceae bacterium]